MAEKLDRTTRAKRRKFIKTGELEHHVKSSAERLLKAIEKKESFDSAKGFSWFVRKEIIILMKRLLRYYVRLLFTRETI